VIHAFADADSRPSVYSAAHWSGTQIKLTNGHDEPMFGFLKPAFRDTNYRQAYARCCSMQHLEFGVSSLPFLSYESVLLYLLTVECGLNPGPPASTPTCCRLRTSRLHREEPDAPFAQISAAFGVLLGLIKLDDDVRDEGRLISRLAHWALSRQQTAVHAVFTSIDDTFSDRVAELIDEHLELERNWQQRRVSLEEYAEPTARSFGYLFSLAARLDTRADGHCLPGSQPANAINAIPPQELLTAIGESIGRAILTFDCARDWEDDQRRGQFNPLPDEAAIPAALDLACASLDEAAWLCETHCGESSLSARVLTSVFERAARFTPRRTARAKRPAWKQQLSDWGLLREPGYVYARCDCCEITVCCDGVGEAATCCGGAGEAAEGATCCSGGHGCGCEACLCCGDDCCDPCVDKSSGRTAELEKLIGDTAFTRTRLKPNGVVLVNGQRERARSEEGTIPVNTRVEVIGVQRSRLIVRPVDEPQHD